MQFLAKHYEKIVLAALLILFLLSMLYLIDIIQSASNLSSKELEIKKREADWTNADFKSDEFNLNYIFMRNTSWNKSVKRGGAVNVFSDLTVMYPVARCPHCGKFVPEYDFKNEPHKCPLCKENLPTPMVKSTPQGPDTTVTPGDSDGDGIPDVVEEKMGLDPKNPSDAYEDMDGDGFSNLFEYQRKTLMNDPKSHPPLYTRLYVSALQQVELDPVLMKVSKSGADKSNWDIQVNTDKNTKTKFLILGDKLQLEPNRDYRIEDVIYDVKKIKEGNVEVQRDESKIICKSVDGKYTITMQVGKAAYSPNPKAFLKDIATDQVYTVDVGDKFRLGSRVIGFGNYTVSAIDTKTWDVQVKYGRRGTGTIGRKPLFRLVKKEARGEEPGANDSGVPKL